MKRWALIIAAAALILPAYAGKAAASVSNFQAKYDESQRTLYFSWEGETAKRFKLFRYPVDKGFSPYGYYSKKTSGSIGFKYPQDGEYGVFVQDDEGNRSDVIFYSVSKDGVSIK